MSTRERQPDTRSRIQQVALELFTEHGYEKTALREIAERLGVTKAALYYHFKTKEDIVVSIVEDGAHTLDKLIDWGRAQPPGTETRRELVRRYASVMRGQRRLMRFFQENQPALRDLAIGDTMKRRLNGLFELLTDPDAPLVDQMRSRLSLFSIHLTMFGAMDLPGSDAERDEASVHIALDLIG